MSIFWIIVVFLIGAVVGVMLMGIAFGAFIDKHNLKHLLTDEPESAAKVPDVEKEIQLNVECRQGQFYVFNATNDKFILQGSTANEVRTKLERKFPKYIVANVSNSELNGVPITSLKLERS